MDNKLTVERLKELLSYDHLTGLFIWIKKSSPRANRTIIGSVAGQNDPSGYKRISIDDTGYWAHRLAWFYINEQWPAGVIDHIDGNRANNAISNLRMTTIAGNIANQVRPHKDNSSGALGVHKRKDTGKYAAYLTKNKKRVTLGSFETLEEASSAYWKARNESCSHTR